MKRFFSKSVFISLFAAVVILTVVIATNSMKKHITIVIDGKEQVVETFKDSVDEVLVENGITVAKKDKFNHKGTDLLSKEDKIEIVRAIPIELTADGAIQSFMTPEKTVEDFLKVENITLNEADKLSVSLEDSVTREMAITIIRVTSELVEETQPIEFAVEEKRDPSLLKGKTEVKSEGTLGERKITKERTYEDGVLVNEVEVGNEVVVEAKDKIVAIGTQVPVVVKAVEPVKSTTSSSSNSSGSYTVGKKPSKSSIYASRGGSVPSELSYSKSFRVEATAYSGHNITATGTKPVRNPGGWSSIAVDRSVIPLGTRVYVENYGYAIAEDVGGAIKGNIIDLFMDSSSQTRSWGRRNVTIYILD
ncbi:MAG: DUF348 domain-containing protein [Clostridium sp.]|nr:DUF348 domain-containing protein [Clostridium sp.]